MSVSPHAQPGTQFFTRSGPWQFAREDIVSGRAAESLFELYRSAFDPLKTQSAARQVLTRDEFFAQLEDRRIDKYVAWEDDHDNPVGIITLTRHLEAVPWISPEYFAARYPEQSARQAVYYMGFILARPMTRQTRFLETIVALCVERLLADQAVIAFDMCSYNKDVLNLSERISRVVRHLSTSHVQQLDTQVYYAVNFT